MWGRSQYTATIQGGTVVLQQADFWNFANYGSPNLNATGGTIRLHNSYFVLNAANVTHVYVSSGITSMAIKGNIFTGGLNLNDQ